MLWQAIARARMEAQIQLSRALIEAKTDKDNAVADAIAQATADKLDGVQHNPDTGIIKVIMRYVWKYTVNIFYY